MTAKAPSFRSIDQLAREHDPSKFFGALSEADNFVAELDGLRELQCRVEELEAERDDLADQLVGLRDAHDVTVKCLSVARRDNEKLRSERDSWRAQAVPR